MRSPWLPYSLVLMATLSLAASDCYDGLGKDYQGPKSQTKDGVPCQRWDNQTPHRHRFTTGGQFPDGRVPDNLCRNPDGESGGPWCYTTDPEPRWAYCGVAKCTDQASRSCYNGLGKDYQGPKSQTKDGVPCQRWDSQSPHPHSFTTGGQFPDGRVPDNLCRNPDGESGGPWCYTTVPEPRWAYCGVAKCSETTTAALRTTPRPASSSLNFSYDVKRVHDQFRQRLECRVHSVPGQVAEVKSITIHKAGVQLAAVWSKPGGGAHVNAPPSGQLGIVVLTSDVSSNNQGQYTCETKNANSAGEEKRGKNSISVSYTALLKGKLEHVRGMLTQNMNRHHELIKILNKLKSLQTEMNFKITLDTAEIAYHHDHFQDKLQKVKKINDLQNSRLDFLISRIKKIRDDHKTRTEKEMAKDTFTIISQDGIQEAEHSFATFLASSHAELHPMLLHHRQIQDRLHATRRETGAVQLGPAYAWDYTQPALVNSRTARVKVDFSRRFVCPPAVSLGALVYADYINSTVPRSQVTGSHRIDVRSHRLEAEGTTRDGFTLKATVCDSFFFYQLKVTWIAVTSVC